MWPSISAQAAIVALYLQGAVAQNVFAIFTYPSQSGLVFRQGDTVKVSYVSNYPLTSLRTWCGDSGSPVEKNLAIPAATMNGTQTVRIDFKGAKDCWFDLREESGTKQGTNSLRFSVAEESSNQPTTWELAAAPSTTSQAPSSTTNPTQSSSASSSPSPSPSPSSMPSTTLLSTTKSDVPISSSNTEKVTQATPSGQNTPSTQTTQPTSSEGAEINKYKIGLGVGIPVGCLLIAGVGVLAYMIRKRRSRNHRFEKSGAMGELPGSHPDPLGKQYSYIGGGTEVAGSQPHAVVELDLRSPPAELEASYKSIPR